jgi:hypothetical protein
MLIGGAVILFSIAAISPARAPRSSMQEPKYEMGTFYLCMLIKPANFTAASAPQGLVQSHLKHVQELLASGKAAIAGPFMDGSRIAGCSAQSASAGKPAQLSRSFIKTGGFSVEVLGGGRRRAS